MSTSGSSGYDLIIVGGGIAGLATALKVNEKNPDKKILLVEKEAKIAAHQTGNNSGVIHSGIYYKPGSLKATNCIRGYHQLIEFCTINNVPFELCGKIIVATSKEELTALENIYQRGLANGLQGLKKLTAEQLKEYEPHVAGISGIHVPQTGIVDYRLVAEAYARILNSRGVDIKMSTKVTGIKRSGSSNIVQTNNGDFHCSLVVSCGGLYADKIAGMTTDDLQVRIVPFRGEYYKLTSEKEYLVKNLIYPVPDPNFPFLGVHFTRMAKGGVEAGPNAVLAFKREGYRKRDINLAELADTLMWPGFQRVASKYWKTGLGEMYRSFSKAAFTRALQKLIPEISENDLGPGGAGVRAQACDRTGGLVDDFMFQESDHAIHVLNAPSPAATSSLSIGDTIAEMVIRRLS